MSAYTRLKPDPEIYGHDYRAYAEIDVTYRPSNPDIGVFVRAVSDGGWTITVEVPQDQFARLVDDYLRERGLKIAMDDDAE